MTKEDAVKNLGSKFGVNIKIDKSLDNTSKTDLFPNQTSKAIYMLSNTHKATTAFHPGLSLLEEIDERGLLKKDVARELEILPHHLSEIFAGKRHISAKIAIKLERLLGISAEYWAGLQISYDLYEARRNK